MRSAGARSAGRPWPQPASALPLLLLVSCALQLLCATVAAQAQSSYSSTGAADADPATVLTVTLSLNMNPNLPLPANFSTELLADLSIGLGVRPDRIALGRLGGATSSSGSASVGTSITFSVLPSTNSSEPTPPQVLTVIQDQFAARAGPLLSGTHTRLLNTAYLLVISTGEPSVATSSSTASNQATRAASRGWAASVAVLFLSTLFAVRQWG